MTMFRIMSFRTAQPSRLLSSALCAGSRGGNLLERRGDLAAESRHQAAVRGDQGLVGVSCRLGQARSPGERWLLAASVGDAPAGHEDAVTAQGPFEAHHV